MTTSKERNEVLARLTRNGIDYDDAVALRRISMTLRRWFELECGDGNDYASWSIERDETTDKPYKVVHYYNRPKPIQYPVPDREAGARKRLQKIMEKYPQFVPYVQTDPRGCALYLCDKADMNGLDISATYNRGLAIY